MAGFSFGVQHCHAYWGFEGGCYDSGGEGDEGRTDRQTRSCRYWMASYCVLREARLAGLHIEEEMHTLVQLRIDSKEEESEKVHDASGDDRLSNRRYGRIWLHLRKQLLWRCPDTASWVGKVRCWMFETLVTFSMRIKAFSSQITDGVGMGFILLQTISTRQSLVAKEAERRWHSSQLISSNSIR